MKCSKGEGKEKGRGRSAGCEMVAADVAIKMSGVEIQLVGVQIEVKDVAGGCDQVERIHFTRFPESNFLFDDSQQGAIVVVLCSPHGGVQFLFDGFLFGQFFTAGPIE